MGPTMRMTQVKSIEDLSPHMRRIVLAGDDLSDFPLDKESAHVKLIFPKPNSADKRPKLGLYLGFKKWMRSYTIRHFDAQQKHLTIDFAVHDHEGLASNWASQAQVGDYLGVAGPGDTRHTYMLAKQHLFLGDLTALPAIAAVIEKLPKNAIGDAWIQIPNVQDIQEFESPKELKVHWIVSANKLTAEFNNALATLPQDLSQTAIFIAAEASVVRSLKSQLNDQHDYDKSKLYASAYWNEKR